MISGSFEQIGNNAGSNYSQSRQNKVHASGNKNQEPDDDNQNNGKRIEGHFKWEYC